MTVTPLSWNYGAGKIMKYWPNFKTNKLQTGLDRGLGFGILKVVNPTALSVYRDGGFYFYEKSIRLY
ncbi:hypothetical protein COS93_02300 [bacterium (Candidatus Gribaldobacteria) CG07_land_8_20_14_0_80_33_18]|uniref:Uncharacterized protein n=1 Tax=bacterium (Candidatus Gribaldobacteria) CG07_land_8_20_14_0_80_33_18 TaxID=2014272 RepID=A0A2M6Z2G8_9BACT|nr:MAG: hypothetical protein COU04_00825 [bacterium (Candidatus Gribaldobacteria) CG10_big_fil_rev_8_21_14_0_10_33_41]PIU46542.1 MAG: hypothetical protein COS93_02300 [bacterium (Candidatus Gribaldobacteria) CG07_land_8_20_14_0_80_33_18]PJA00503.1 MAG: hypothetical protein COX75_02245 [bacterium (Candidatus Gribaldobacteria) CG_4_10_14_0_2_um_filter_33_15]PJB08261.1 MAG: hypothetical protein CO122_02220 [bacterium (Candidatus Gribaldobacteria) CG_4_9_14_3_um_filter_33_9]